MPTTIFGFSLKKSDERRKSKKTFNIPDNPFSFMSSTTVTQLCLWKGHCAIDTMKGELEKKRKQGLQLKEAKILLRSTKNLPKKTKLLIACC